MTHLSESRSSSPKILTPDAEHHAEPHTRTIMLGSDSEERMSDIGDRHKVRPVSLLTALIQTTEKQPASLNIAQRSTAGIASAQSSAPSTAFSSPRIQGHGILQQTTSADLGSTSILRRESASGASEGAADGQAVGLGLGGIENLKHRLAKVEEKRERIEWADTVPYQTAPPRTGGLKFAVASTLGHHHPAESSKSVKPYFLSTPNHNDNDEEMDTDDGYQEDEEDGYGSDSSDGFASEDTDPRYPFARSTNFDERPRYIGSTQIPAKSPSPAPALLPPPSRRGRGHIRVDESSAPAEHPDKTCSRHRSPPPIRSRSGSHVRSSVPSSPSKRSHRLSDAGPRDGRAGSPMPTRLSSESDDDELGNDEGAESLEGANRGFLTAIEGWRSDNAVFYGPYTRTVRPISSDRRRRHSSALAESTNIFVDSGEEEVGDRLVVTGVRELLRRASEHLPGFSRQAVGQARPFRNGAISPSTAGSHGQMRSQTPCPPALDDTPATALDMYTGHYGDPAGGLAHRLESALSAAPPVVVSVTQRPERPTGGD